MVNKTTNEQINIIRMTLVMLFEGPPVRSLSIYSITVHMIRFNGSL